MTTNTNSYLAPWRGRADFGEIAKRANHLVNVQGLSITKMVEVLMTEYLPRATYREKSPKFEIFGEPGVDIDWGAIEQMKKALRLPVAVAGALMPDAHQRYALPIGGVVELENAISPAFVGYDIACRMTLTILDITPKEFMAERLRFAEALRSVTSFGKGAAGFDHDHPVMYDSRWSEIKALKQYASLARLQLGSSGGGNHFADLLVGRAVKDGLGLRRGQEFVALMTHSGSRGTGHEVATYYAGLASRLMQTYATRIPKGYEYLPADSEVGQEYLSAMNLLGEYARANHQLVHDGFCKATGLRAEYRFENHHNFAWATDRGTYIHRKGATPAGKNVPGIIPGSSGSKSYLVIGKGNEASLRSSSHGAGRPFSRSVAKARHNEEFVTEWMKEHDVITFGLAPDETVMAYKDIERVMNLQSDLVTVVAEMEPKVVLMGGESDDGD